MTGTCHQARPFLPFSRARFSGTELLPLLGRFSQWEVPEVQVSGFPFVSGEMLLCFASPISPPGQWAAPASWIVWKSPP